MAFDIPGSLALESLTTSCLLGEEGGLYSGFSENFGFQGEDAPGAHPHFQAPPSVVHRLGQTGL